MTTSDRKSIESTDPRPRRARASRMIGFGILLLVIGAILMLAPLLLGRGSLNKYLVAFGFFGACVALSLLVHGAWDWWRG